MRYQRIIGVIIGFGSGSCCATTINVMTDQGPVNLVLSGRTRVVDNVRLRRGMRIAAFYDSSLPVLTIFPPQYQAEIIASLNRNQQADINFFNQNLVAVDRSLRLNIAPSTRIGTINGQPFSCNLGNQTLLVFYTETTRSIPPQTTPQRVIVLCG